MTSKFVAMAMAVVVCGLSRTLERTSSNNLRRTKNIKDIVQVVYLSTCLIVYLSTCLLYIGVLG